MRVAITGAAGFIGGKLAKCMALKGIEVHALLRDGSPVDRLSDAGIVQHRITEAPHSLQQILENVKPRIVYHLAARYVAEHKADDIPGLIADNVTFSTRIFDACARTGVGNVVATSTNWQHFSESNNSPVNLYAATKAAQELIGAYFVDACGLRATFLRLTDTYGPNDQRQKLFSLLRAAVRSGQEIQMSPGEQLLELVYIDDVVAALIHAGGLCERLTNGSCAKWSLRAKRAYSLKEIVSIWEQAAGTVVPIKWGGRPYRTREVMRPWHEAPPLPGWEPRIELREGIALMEQVRVRN